ncbi:MAG TPA: hypothetical protein PKN81_17200, partial [Anaerolineales bacterium]|nr:hypothetical protein [Anaerolineales bacterium]
MLIYFIFPLIVVLIGLLIEYWVIQPLRKNGIPISFQTTVSSIIQRMTSFIKPDKINEESSPSEKKTS